MGPESRTVLVATILTISFVSLQSPPVLSLATHVLIFPQAESAFTVTQTCSPQGQITPTSLTITMGTCTPEFADVTASSQRFYVDAVTWNAVYNGTNTAPTTSNPPNEMVGFLTDDIESFNSHEIGIICKLDEGLFIGYYQDHTEGGAGFQTTGSLGSCVGGPNFTTHNFSLNISYNGTVDTFVFGVDTNTRTLKYSSPTNYTRLLMWWWMAVHRNGNWNVPTGTLTQYNSVNIKQDTAPLTVRSTSQNTQSSDSRSSRSALTPGVNTPPLPALFIGGFIVAFIALLIANHYGRRGKGRSTRSNLLIWSGRTPSYQELARIESVCERP